MCFFVTHCICECCKPDETIFQIHVLKNIKKGNLKTVCVALAAKEKSPFRLQITASARERPPRAAWLLLLFPKGIAVAVRE